MPSLDPLKRSIPTELGDSVHPGVNLGAYSLTNPGIVEVSSEAEADIVLEEYNTACQGTVTPRPLYVWRSDIENLMRNRNTPGAGWEYIAGRQHGATVEFSRDDHREGADPPPSLFADYFVRASQGWTMSDDANLVIPQTGMYTFGVQIAFSGLAGTLGRVFYDLVTNNDGIGLDRRSATDEDNFGGTHVMPLSAGNKLKIRAYHETGGDRNVTATMQIAMINSPRW